MEMFIFKKIFYPLVCLTENKGYLCNKWCVQITKVIYTANDVYFCIFTGDQKSFWRLWRNLWIIQEIEYFIYDTFEEENKRVHFFKHFLSNFLNKPILFSYKRFMLFVRNDCYFCIFTDIKKVFLYTYGEKSTGKLGYSEKWISY